MEEAIRILLGSRDVSAAENPDIKALHVDGGQNVNPCSSNSCFVAAERKGTNSKAGSRDRIEKVLHKLYDKKPSRRNKKANLLLAIDKSLRTKLERINPTDVKCLSISNDVALLKTINSRSRIRPIRKRPCLPHPYNVYSYYYLKYDMSYGHCLYVTPWTLEVPEDNTDQLTQSPIMAKQVSLRSLERNWKMLGCKRRVNSARRSYTFPADADWDSTIYYFPRCDLSFYPLPFSRIRPHFGDYAPLPAETVLEEENDFTPLDDSSCWKDLVESEEKITGHGSCLTSDRTDLDSRSESSNCLPSKDAFSRTWKTRNLPRNLCTLALITVPDDAEDNWQYPSGFRMRKNEHRMKKDRLNDIESEQKEENLTKGLCVRDSSWQGAETHDLRPAETNTEHTDASEGVFPHGDGDFERNRRTTHCQQSEKVSTKEPMFVNLGKVKKAQTQKPKAELSSVTSQSNAGRDTKTPTTFKDTNSPARFSLQVNNIKSRKIEAKEKRFCNSIPKDGKSFPCSQRQEIEPLESVGKFKNNGTPLEEIPKRVFTPKGNLKLFGKKPRVVSAPRGDERKQGDGNMSRKPSNAVWGSNQRVKYRERHEGNTSQKNNIRCRNVVMSGPRELRDLGDRVLLAGPVKPGDNADLIYSEGNSTVPQDGHASTNSTKCESCHVNQTDETVFHEHLGDDFIPACNTTSTRIQGKIHTFSVSVASIKETKGPHTTREKQDHSGKPRQHMLKVDPIGRNFNKSSVSITHDFVCGSKVSIHTGGIFDVLHRHEKTDIHTGRPLRKEGLSEESCRIGLLCEQEGESPMHNMYTLLKEEKVSVVEKQRISEKCVKVERKTAMQKLVFVRSSVSGIPNKTKAEDVPRKLSTLAQGSTIDLRVPERRASVWKTAQATKKCAVKNGKTECKSSYFDEFKQSDSTPIGESIQIKLKPRLRTLLDRPLVVLRKVPKTYLSIWQNRKARYAEFLKRNPAFASISNEHRTNRSCSRLSGFNAIDSERGSPKSCPLASPLFV